MGSAKQPQGSSKKGSKSALERHEKSSRSTSVASVRGSPKSPPTPGTPASKASTRKRSSAKKNWNHSHLPPLPEDRGRNGRQEGRNLITWTRPRMAEKLLLHIQYECSRHKIELPWDAISHRLHPGSSGGAVLQHMNRLRHTLVAEGHLVPPICQKPGSRVRVDPSIRGYVRANMEGQDCVTTRPVPFNEPMDDRRFNIPDTFDDTTIPGSVKRKQQGGEGLGRQGQGKGKKKTTKSKAVIKTESPDPADLDGDADYDPSATKSTTSRRRSSRARSTFSYRDPSPSDQDEEPMTDADADAQEISSSQGDSDSEDKGHPASYPSSSEGNYDADEDDENGHDGNAGSGDSGLGDDEDGYDDGYEQDDSAQYDDEQDEGYAGDYTGGYQSHSGEIGGVEQEELKIKSETSSPGSVRGIQAAPVPETPRALEAAQTPEHTPRGLARQYSQSPLTARAQRSRQVSQVPQSPYLAQSPHMPQYFPNTQGPNMNMAPFGRHHGFGPNQLSTDGTLDGHQGAKLGQGDFASFHYEPVGFASTEDYMEVPSVPNQWENIADHASTP
ncbi:uncharacterized protein E0L32_006400 [Thyridium curvatum]|uniref:Uncharacterized protein n=1 Tax=Thyridium curvatum TaxID=1093900 RepID=A0A507B9D2_9PEZI|nr:uncharacterized protein E0L32_006400 [Thyridium curvatum]TPX13200.1 hypothetical protein E0L32_006400 [Thyridium curvatum]